MAWTTPSTWVSGAILTATQLNQQVRDNLVNLYTGTGWTVATLSNSWVSYDGGAVYDVPSYCRVGSIVYLKGLMKSGTTATTILTLPAGFRPLKTRQFNLQSQTSVCRATITSAGVLSIVGYDTGGSNASVSLDQISFLAEA